MSLCYGEDSDLTASANIEKWRKKNRHISDIVTKGGHLFPFEFPEITADLIANILNNNLSGEKGLVFTANQIGEDVKVYREGGVWNGAIAINADPDAIFEWLTEPDKLVRLDTDIVRFEFTHETENKIGSTYQVELRDGLRKTKFEGRITGYETGKYFSAIQKTNIISVASEYSLNPANGSTVLEAKLNITYKGPGKLAPIIFGKTLHKVQRQTLAKNLRKIKAVCEQNPPHHPIQMLHKI